VLVGAGYQVWSKTESAFEQQGYDFGSSLIELLNWFLKVDVQIKGCG